MEMKTVTQHANELARGETSSSSLTEEMRRRIGDPSGEGKRTFVRTYEALARALAESSDILRKAGVSRSPIGGLPVKRLLAA